MKNVKRLVQKINVKDLQYHILQYNNTPRVDGKIPAKLFFGRDLSFDLPVKSAIPSASQPLTDTALKPLCVGSTVYLQDHQTKRWSLQAVITAVDLLGRSYTLQLPDGSLTRRNRIFLRPVPLSTPSVQQVAPGSLAINYGSCFTPSALLCPPLPPPELTAP